MLVEEQIREIMEGDYEKLQLISLDDNLKSIILIIWLLEERDLYSEKSNNIRWLGKCQPLAIMNDGSLLTIRNRVFYLQKSGNKKKIGRIKRKSILTRISLFRRLFRLDIRCGFLENEDIYLFFLDKALYELRIKNGRITRLFVLPDNQSTPLSLQKGFKKYRVIWGEYCQNTDKHDVSIYGLTFSGDVNVVWTYKNKNIRHIHNIISDGENGYYVFTGDNEKDAGIYYHGPEFDGMTPVYKGNQNARAVVGFSTKKGLLYATDSVVNKNHVFLLRNRDTKELKIVDIGQLNGSVIYGTECTDGWLFSTTVESPEIEKKSFLGMLSTRRGKGILSDEVELVHIDRNMNKRTLLSFTKDKMPYKLFQYGCIMFPSGLTKVRGIYFYPVAVRKFDGKMGFLKYEHINTDK